jgi:hypothetical protein
MVRQQRDDDDAGASETITVRLTPSDRAVLDRLVELRNAELEHEGIRLKPSTYVRGLIRREAKAKGLDSAEVLAAATAKAPPPETPAPERKAKGSREPSHDEVRAALSRAVESGTSQADIARRSKIDPAQLSRFKRGDGGLSPERLRTLAAVLGPR